MVFKCQKDSFLTEFSAKVISCKKSATQIVQNGKKTSLDGYDVVLEDTILFPEGGGQPYDLGWLDDKEVIQVTRSGEKAVHFMLEPVTEGVVVNQRINWERRFDHMQQHSGQHLLSAILESEHLLKTTSWWLGEDECYVELECTSITPEKIKEVEDRCNSLIRDAVPVTVTEHDISDPDISEAHTRGLPKDQAGKLRIVKIYNIDENLCCGTHVMNLSQLQVIKLLRAEPGKKGKINLRFVVGQRVIAALQKKIEREQAMTALLNNDPSRHEDLVIKLQQSLKLANKNLQAAMSTIAENEVLKIKSAEPKPKYFCLHRKEADSEFMRAVSKGLEDSDIFVFLASGGAGKSTDGNILLQGLEKDVSVLGPRVSEILQGKGAGKHNKFQAKVANLKNLPACIKLIEEHFG